MLLHQSLSSTGAAPPLLLRRYSLNLRNKIHKPCITSPSHFPSVCLHIGTEAVSEITQNKVIVGALVSAVIGQISKPFTSVLLYGNKFELNSRWITRAGGFPSAHSSAVVATATSLGLERGVSDAIFGLAVVYAAIVMYDAQGVRREVGNHASVINKNFLEAPGSTCLLNDANNLTDSSSQMPSPSSLEIPDPLLVQDASSTEPMKNSFLPERTKDGTNQAMSSTLIPFKITTNFKEGLGNFVGDYALLKEWVGHTEVEVVAGAILGFLVSFIIHAT